MSFWIDGPAETDEQWVEAWQQQFPDIVADVLDTVANSVRDYPPGSLASLQAFEELVLAQLPDQGSMKNPAAGPLIKAAVGYRGETLRRAVGGRWVRGRGEFGGMPCVAFDAELGLPLLPPFHLVARAVQIRDGRQFARTAYTVERRRGERRTPPR